MNAQDKKSRDNSNARELKVTRLNCSGLKTREELHAYLQATMKLDEHYGANLDALWDILSERPPRKIFVSGSVDLQLNLGTYAEDFLELLDELQDLGYRVEIDRDYYQN